MGRALPLLLLLLGPALRGGGPEVRIVYDNTSARPDLRAGWGFAAVVTLDGRRLLFDSGADPDLFLENLRKMDVRPDSIQAAVISHEHDDHIGGIFRLHSLYFPMAVHFLESFPPQEFAEAVSVGLQPKRVNGPEEILPGLFSTGLVAGHPDEQALAIPTAKGLVVITGCSHPGVVRMVEAAERSRGVDRVRLLVGGFHLLDTPPQEIEAIAARLKALRVERVMPAHCTGEKAMKILDRVYGQGCERAGAGKRIELD